MIRSSLVVAALLGWSNVAGAQPASEPPEPQPEPSPAPAPTVVPMPEPVPAPAPPPPPDAGHRITLMWAPLRLVVPLVELTGEYRVKDKLGVSVTVGFGNRTVESSSGEEASGTEIEGGAQVRYYAIGDFDHGMEVGVEGLYEYVKFDEPLPATILAVSAGGFTVGPFLGYKIATGVGFTFEAQLGARYLAIEPTTQGMGTATITESKWLPLLHLNIGWSF